MIGYVSRNRRGFYTYIDGQFAIIDRQSHSLIKEGEKWKFKKQREIRDRKGNPVPILYPVKRIENVLLIEGKVVIRSGERELERMTLEDGLKRGLVRVLSEEVNKRPFLKGSREIMYETITGDKSWEWETVPLTKEEQEILEQERKEWLKLLTPAPSLAKKREQKNTLKLRIRKEIEELERKREELSEAPRLELSHVRKHYEFFLTPDGVGVVEVKYNTSPRLHFPSGRWEDGDKKDYEYVAVEWENVPFDRNEIKKKLLSLKKKREEELKKVERRLSTLKKRLERVESVKLDKSKLRIHDLRELALDDDFWGLDVFPSFPRRVVKDEEFWKVVAKLPTRTPQGLLLGIAYVGAVPRSLYEKAANSGDDLVVDYLDWWESNSNSGR